MNYKLTNREIENLHIEKEGKELLSELNEALIIAGKLSPSDLLYEFKENEKNKLYWDFKELITKDKLPSKAIEDLRYQISEIEIIPSDKDYYIFYISPQYKLREYLENAISSIVKDKNRFALAVDLSGKVYGNDVLLKLIRFNIKEVDVLINNFDDLDDLDLEIDEDSSADLDKDEQNIESSNELKDKIADLGIEEYLLPQKHLYHSEYEDDDPTSLRFDEDEEILYGHRLDITKLGLEEQFELWLLDFDKYGYLVDDDSRNTVYLFRLFLAAKKRFIPINYELFYSYTYDSPDILDELIRQLWVHCNHTLEDDSFKIIILNVKKGIQNEKKILKAAETRLRELCNPKSNVRIIITEDRVSDHKGDAELMLIWLSKS